MTPESEFQNWVAEHGVTGIDAIKTARSAFYAGRRSVQSAWAGTVVAIAFIAAVCYVLTALR